MENPGWHIDAETLLPVIDDEQTFRRSHADDPALEALVALWSGQTRTAENLLRPLVATHNTPRYRALLADAWRDQGRHDDAIATYADLVAETAGSAREAVMRQHLGKAYFAAGDFTAAHAEFVQALTLRERDGADAELIESSHLAVERAATLMTRA